MYLKALPAFAIVVVGSAYLTISVYVMFNKSFVVVVVVV